MRRGEPPLSDDAVVLRGGSGLREDQLREDATLNYEEYGFYGISMWSPTPEVPQEALLHKLRRFPRVTVFTAADLYRQDLRLWDTGQSPHYDVVYVTSTDLDHLVAGLLASQHTVIANPHHDPEGA